LAEEKRGIERNLDGGSNDFAFPYRNDSIWQIVESTTILKACFVKSLQLFVVCAKKSADEEKETLYREKLIHEAYI